MKKRLPYLLILLAVLLTACNKNKKYETTVSGYITEKGGDRRLAGAKVYLIERIRHTYNTEEIRRDSTISGPDGSYSFDFNLGEKRLAIYAYHENYYPIEKTHNSSEIKIIELGEDQQYDVALWPYAWLKLRMINESGADGVDINPLPGGVSYQVYGEDDATIISRTVGNRQVSLDYFVQPTGTHFSRSLNCPGLDTTYLEIRY